MNPKLKSLLGLARRAGKIVVGDESCMKAVRANKAQLVVLAADASDSTLKRYNDKCAYYKTELVVIGSRFELGEAIGKPQQVVLVILDQGFADGIRACRENTEVQSIE